MSCLQGDASSKTVQLTEGRTSLVELLVTAEDGRTTKSYTISIRRLSADDACLSQLDISAGTIKPSFSPSVYEYFCFLPGSLDALTLRAGTEDAAMKVSMKDGGAVGKVSLNAGHSLLEVQVTSVSGKNTTLYSLTATRMRSPYELLLKEPRPRFSCGICGGTVHCPCRVSSNPVLHCWRCLEEMSRISKADPLTGKLLGEKWLVLDYAADRELSSLAALCYTPYGQLEGELTQLPATLLQQRASYKEMAEQVIRCVRVALLLTVVSLSLLGVCRVQQEGSCHSDGSPQAALLLRLTVQLPSQV